MIAFKKCYVKRKEYIKYRKEVIFISDLEMINAKRAYKKEWRSKNKDKVKAANDRFYKKYAERKRAALVSDNENSSTNEKTA